jgi:predicted nucleotidyltransferase component of viral defense system
MKIPEFSGLYLVGGTALALQAGHRKSIDLDLFGILTLDEFEFTNTLKIFDSVTLINRTANIKTFLINQIKVDFVNYPYQWIEPCINIDSIRLAGKSDIAAMKLAAITGRGTKKDFIDLVTLLDEFTLDKMLQFYNRKFPDGSEFMVLKSLTYFKDAETDQPPVMLRETDWNKVKWRIISETKKLIESR